MSDSVKTTRKDGIFEVVLDRPKANAIDGATSRAMSEAFVTFRDDPSLRVAILTGAGTRFFSAGWDLKAAAEGATVEEDFGPGGFGGLSELPNLNKPVIAAANGMAVGGGFELLLAADLVVAAEHAEFFLSETRMGVIPDSASFRLPKQLPRPLAMEMLLTGRHYSARETQGLGLINQVVQGPDVMDAARAMAAEILKGAPLAVEATKEIVRMGEGMPVAECYRTMRSKGFPTFERLLVSEDIQEGPRAFAEKRDPMWKGR